MQIGDESATQDAYMRKVGRKGARHAQQKAAGGDDDDNGDGEREGDRPSQLPSLEQKIVLLDGVRIELCTSSTQFARCRSAFRASQNRRCVAVRAEKGQRAQLRVRLLHPELAARRAEVAPVPSIEYENMDAV